ncbi:hypothetical protein B0H19DRAFT_424939 [Mycena capillaripes]|nr:hypothetical protein B0H19DRAFT_424939 [Mycena capillaripes]
MTGPSNSHKKSITLMLNSLQMLWNIEHLSINITLWEEHRLAIVGEGGIFPLITSFLKQHPSLKTFSSPLRGFIDADPPVPLSLPHLRNFRGPVTLIPLVSGARDLNEVKLSWGRKHPAQDVENIARTLKAMTRDDVPFICSNDDCGDSFVDVLDSISRNLPYTRTLQMRGSGVNVSSETKLSHLKNCLPRFTGLLFLSVMITVVTEDTALPEEVTRRMAQDLGDVCPSLEACRFNRYAWRKLNGMWERYPFDDFPGLAGISFPEVMR